MRAGGARLGADAAHERHLDTNQLMKARACARNADGKRGLRNARASVPARTRTHTHAHAWHAWPRTFCVSKWGGMTMYGPTLGCSSVSSAAACCEGFIAGAAGATGAGAGAGGAGGAGVVERGGCAEVVVVARAAASAAAAAAAPTDAALPIGGGSGGAPEPPPPPLLAGAARLGATPPPPELSSAPPRAPPPPPPPLEKPASDAVRFSIPLTSPPLLSSAAPPPPLLSTPRCGRGAPRSSCPLKNLHTEKTHETCTNDGDDAAHDVAWRDVRGAPVFVRQQQFFVVQAELRGAAGGCRRQVERLRDRLPQLALHHLRRCCECVVV
jgi:hypothetical protein